jgi:probable phosphoglycerate mutase
MHGQYDSLVTPRGHRQIEELARRFDGVRIDAVYSSDLYRARTTAEAVYKSRKLPLVTSRGLREVHMGVWEDQPFGEAEYRVPGDMLKFNNDPWRWAVEGSEAIDAVRERVTRALTDIAERHAGGTVAVFSHGFAIRTFLSGVHGITTPEGLKKLPYFDNTAVTRLIYKDGAFAVDYQGDSAHLSDGNSTLARQKWWRDTARLGDVNMRFIPNGASFDALLGAETAGFVRLDASREAFGWIERFELAEPYKNRGLGIQLIGQAVSAYRAAGRERLRTAVDADDAAAIGFLTYFGFEKAEADGRTVILEKDIAVR